MSPHILNGSIAEALARFETSGENCRFPLQVRDTFRCFQNWLPVREANFALADVTAAFARRLRDKAARERGWRFGNYTLFFLQAVVKAAVDAGGLSTNRVKQVPKILPPRQRSNQRRRIKPARHRTSAISQSAQSGESTR